MYATYLSAWALCGLAAWRLFARMQRLRTRKTYPLLWAWSLWIAAAYSGTFAVNFFNMSAYRSVWPYCEIVGASMGIFATRELFRAMCDEIPNIGRFRRWLFHGALGAAFLVSVGTSAAVAIDGHPANAFTLKLASAAGLLLSIFLGANLAFFKVFRQSHSSNLRAHARGLALFLALYGICKFAGQFKLVAHTVSIILSIASAVLFLGWARLLCSGGDTPAPRGGTGNDLRRLASDMRELAAEVR